MRSVRKTITKIHLHVSGWRHEHFATNFVNIGGAVLWIWSFVHFTMTNYGGRHFVNLHMAKLEKYLQHLAQFLDLQTVKLIALNKRKIYCPFTHIILHKNGYRLLNVY